jgi:hypothetical protein
MRFGSYGGGVARGWLADFDSEWRGWVRSNLVGQMRLGAARCDLARNWFGRSGGVCRGGDRCGLARQIWIVMAWKGMFWRGPEWLGSRGLMRLGPIRYGLVR